jgi:peptidoglycan/LPS O-acetylase OafA/YrhL
VDALRGLACLMVMLHHTFGQMPVPGHEFGQQPIPSGFWHYPSVLLLRVAAAGWLGVSLFLALSGFCLFYPLAARGRLRLDLADFARRRARRILPPYYIALLLLSVLELAWYWHGPGGLRWRDALASDGGARQHLRDAALHLLMLHNLSRSSLASVNPAFWSLALECQLYVLFPLLVWGAARWGMRAVLAATLPVAVAWQYLCFRHLGLTMQWTPELAAHYHALPGRCFEFAAGMAAAALVARPRPGQARAALLLLVLLLPPLLWFVLHVSRFGPGVDPAWGVVSAAALVLACAAPLRWFERPLLGRGLVRLGAISYSVYLVHQPLILILSPRLLHLPVGLRADFLTGLLRIPLLIAVGYGFHLLFERPFMPGRPRTGRQAEVAAAVSPAP